MSTSNVQFSHKEFLAARKRYNLGIVDDESDTSRSSIESLGGDETPLLSASRLASTFVTPLEVLRRIGLSLVPPLHPSRVLLKPPVDPVGPALVVTLLISILIYVSSKIPPFEYRTLEAILFIISYLFFTSSTVFLLGKIFSCGRFQITFLQVLALLGYSLFGHLLSLSISYAFYTYPESSLRVIHSVSEVDRITNSVSTPQVTTSGTFSSSFAIDYDEGSSVYNHGFGAAEDVDGNSRAHNQIHWGDTAFLFCLVLVAGPATLRLVLILLSPIQSPPGRMVLGTILCLSHLLLLIVLHASFMHPTFQYGAKG